MVLLAQDGLEVMAIFVYFVLCYLPRIVVDFAWIFRQILFGKFLALALWLVLAVLTLKNSAIVMIKVSETVFLVRAEVTLENSVLSYEFAHSTFLHFVYFTDIGIAIWIGDFADAFHVIRIKKCLILSTLRINEKSITIFLKVIYFSYVDASIFVCEFPNFRDVTSRKYPFENYVASLDLANTVRQIVNEESCVDLFTSFFDSIILGIIFPKSFKLITIGLLHSSFT
jgi:hypothetical protein